MNSAHIPGQPETNRASAGLVDGLDAPADISKPAATPSPKTEKLADKKAPDKPAIKPQAPSSKTIKRYSNRKLYDTTRSKYVTLDEIARMVRNGEDVRIIDNESKEDLTSVTLTQIIYEQEKTTRRMPLGILRGIIQTRGGTLNEWIETMTGAQKSASVVDLRQGANTIRDVASRQLSDLRESARRFFSREERRAAEFKRTMIHHLDHLEARLTERADEIYATRTAIEQHGLLDDDEGPFPSVDEVLEQNTSTLSQVNEFRTRISALSVLVDRLEKSAQGSQATTRSTNTSSPLAEVKTP